MQRSMIRPGNHVIKSYEAYSDMLFRIAMVHLGRRQDAEEAVQDTFIKLMEKAPDFNDAEHQKAWLIRVLTNTCKTMLGRGWRKREVKLDGAEALAADGPEDLALLQLVMALPVKVKTVIHLYYYEDYSVQKISSILQISESAVKMRLQRGRQLLKLELEGAETE
ncbi:MULTISPECIES: RNA polymerase sigma factor [unclassified Paenibacillus]|uniref:RNA polymerase sigma factor n=1 Tax=unclassified Paenibacillus TaxID=185978 RepID=UPI002406F3C0|nr:MULTISPECIES: RNA polymerase sigma factor [unclassified Paenibacillus]MDF9843598.1 RNA polymerase sigma factor (sigma-70 family) [Paenibacillus sp. PastF-2]MDF9850187.1 RNA polymerase sigma factor (sigma-70 family) [Paenibacillus sp. PastM-2]MDF9856873.1 RNA polymerase sigma factor (sigma-70 family) [Paenibacillus sp. PastF-1]MDH6482034.1 RNA polymerase sigma factor (sigma-70 family) [Paenibacillus sp. PastH-2]MDH6509458.1 RNA polymerase sigma factor (sigma-70 family) [Paenibacillus sp. Pas